MEYKKFEKKHKRIVWLFFVLFTINILTIESKQSFFNNLRNLIDVDVSNYTLIITNNSLIELNNHTLIKELYDKDKCTELINNYQTMKSNYLYFPNTPYTYSLLNSFFWVNEASTKEIQRYILNITSYDTINSSELNMLIFLESFVFLAVVILIVIIFCVICCFCSCYDYCPIICKISQKNEKQYKKLTFYISLFIIMNLIFPFAFSIYNFL
jgi:hypothetical protein